MSEGIEVSECEVASFDFAKLGVGKLRVMRGECRESSRGGETVKGEEHIFKRFK